MNGYLQHCRAVRHFPGARPIRRFRYTKLHLSSASQPALTRCLDVGGGGFPDMTEKKASPPTRSNNSRRGEGESCKVSVTSQDTRLHELHALHTPLPVCLGRVRAYHAVHANKTGISSQLLSCQTFCLVGDGMALLYQEAGGVPPHRSVR